MSLLLLMGIWCASLSSTVAAPPEITHLNPSGGTRGQKVAANIVGKLGARPVFVWCSRDDVQVEVSPDQDTLEISTKPNVPPGVLWLRLYNAEGASVLRPFIVGLHGETAEKEPNSALQQAQELQGTINVVNGVLAESQDVDTFKVALKQGETLVASMTANQILGSPMDGVLQIVSAEGIVLAQNDDEREFDPRIVFQAPSDGTYSVRTFAFPADPNQSIRFSNSAAYVYRLTLSTGPFADHAWPLAISKGSEARVALRGWNLGDQFQSVAVVPPDNKPIAGIVDERLTETVNVQVVPHPVFVERAKGQDLPAFEVPATICGQVVQPNEQDEYKILGKKGETLIFEIQSREIGFPLDPVLTLFGPDGKQIAQADDSGSGKEDATLSHTIPADGEYRLRVEDRFGHASSRYVYALHINVAKPDYKLTVANDVYTMTADKPLEIEVNIERLNGFSEDVTITATELPAGVVVKSVVSPKEGDAAKKVKLILEASGAPERPGTFQIVGSTSQGQNSERTAKAPLAAFKSEIADLWLNVPNPKLPRPPVVAKRPGK